MLNNRHFLNQNSYSYAAIEVSYFTISGGEGRGQLSPVKSINNETITPGTKAPYLGEAKMAEIDV